MLQAMSMRLIMVFQVRKKTGILGALHLNHTVLHTTYPDRLAYLEHYT